MLLGNFPLDLELFVVVNPFRGVGFGSIEPFQKSIVKSWDSAILVIIMSPESD